MYAVNKKRLIRTFTDLAKISSPSWNENGVIEYVTKQLGLLNISYKKYRCGESFNLLIRLEGNPDQKPVLFSAHMDTVTPCKNVKPVVRKDRITSNGNTILGSDDKSAIAIFLEGLRHLKETGRPHGPVEIMLSCAEEAGLHGARSFDTSAVKSGYAFVFDSDGRVGKVVLKAPYHLTFDITIRGKAAHAGMEPEKGINAINVLAGIITKLPPGRIDRETTLNVGVISGGRATNIVAEEAYCKLEIRSIDKLKLRRYEKKVKDIIRKVCAHYRATPSVRTKVEYSGFSIRKDDPIVKIASGALRKIGITPQFQTSGGGSDTNIFNKAGVRAVNLSCGMQKVHTTDEFILIKDLVDGAKLMLSIIDTV